MYNRFGKRTFDIVIAGSLILLVTPLIIILSLAIRAESSGPAIFRQERVGRRGKRFTILKLRTMFEDRPTHSTHQEAVVTNGADGRITRVGRILRLTSLDELPQLVNVFLGTMSLVGPRPILPVQLAAVDEPSKIRFDVRPGITGLAQVNGRRNIAWPKQMKLDVDYVTNLSWSYDVRILLKTASAVFEKENIYGDEKSNWRSFVQPIRAAGDHKEHSDITDSEL